MINQKQLMLDELAKQPELVVVNAYLYAKALTDYGVDISEDWDTLAKQSAALKEAYSKGYCDGVKEHDTLSNRRYDPYTDRFI